MTKTIFFIICIFLVVINVLNVKAEVNDFDTVYDYVTASADTLGYGLRFYLNKTEKWQLHNITLYNTNPTYCEISTPTLDIQRVATVGNLATFTDVILNESIWYHIVCDDNGDSWARGYDASYNYNTTFPDVVVESGVDRNPYDSGTFGYPRYVSQIMTMYLSQYEEPTETPTLTINHNLTNTININTESLSFGYNGTYEYTTGLFNCSLGWNGVINQTYEVNVSFNQNFNITYGAIEQNISVNIYCENADASDNTTVYWYAIDTIQPDITLITPLDLNNTNYVLDTNLEVTFNLTDTNAFAYNVSWYEPDGTLIQQIYVENLTGASYLNTSSYILNAVGTNYSITVWMADSHNPIDGKVKPLHWYTDNINLFAEDFTFEGDFKFFNNKNDLVTYFYLEDNKYKMQLTFEEDALIHYLNVSATGSLDYRPSYEDGYLGHFVYLPKMRYIDFMGDNIKNVTVTDCGGKWCLAVELYEESDEILLESVGDLNYNELTYYFSVYSQDTEYLASIDLTLTDINQTMVRRGDIMVVFPFLPLMIGLLLMVGSAMLGQEHVPMKIFLFVTSILTPIVSLQYGIEIFSHYNSDFTSIINDLGVHSAILAGVFFLVFIYFMLYSAVRLIEYLKEQKKASLRY